MLLLFIIIRLPILPVIDSYRYLSPLTVECHFFSSLYFSFFQKVILFSTKNNQEIIEKFPSLPHVNNLTVYHENL